MYNECRHILPSGCKCHSPALTGKPFCYYHANLRRKHSTAGSAAKRLPVPQIEDARGIQLTLQQVLAAVESPFIHRRAIGHTLYGLQLAIQLLGRIQPPAPAEVVRTLCNPEGEPIHQPDHPDQNQENQEEQKDQMVPKNPLDQLNQTDQMIQTDQTNQNDSIDSSDPGPDLLAPIKTVCEPPHDCLHCIHQEACDNYQEPDDNPTFEVEDDDEEEEEEEDNEEEEGEEESEANDEDDKDDEPEDEDLEAADDDNNAEAPEDAESPEEQQLITAALRILQKESPPRNRKTSHRKPPPDPLAA